jgi:cell division protein FtsI (penicillin-binding protein 3)
MNWLPYLWVFLYVALVIIVLILATFKKGKNLSKGENKPFLRRFFVVYAIITFGFAAIINQIVKIQYEQGEELRKYANRYYPLADTITAKRGNILSHDGRLLSSSIPYYYLYMDMRVERLKITDNNNKTFFENNVVELSDSLAKKLGGKSSDYEKKLRQGFQAGTAALKLHPKPVSYLDYLDIKKFPILKLGAIQGGFYTEERIERDRPFGSLALRTIGGVYGIEGRGKNGLEMAYDSLLKGKNGLAIRRKKAGKNVQIITKAPEDGMDIVSTIDIDIQEVAEQALRERLTWSESDQGCVVLMETATGKIRAISNLLWDAKSKQYYETQNIAVSNEIDPGSTFKTASFLVAMEDGYIDSTTMVDTQNGKMKFAGRTMHDHNGRGFGIASVPTVMHQSSNVGVSSLIVEHYGKNPQKFVDGVHKLGFTQPINLEIPGHGSVKIKTPGAKDWYGTTLPWMSIGYEIQVPPIYTLMLYNAIANNGTMVKPIFTEKILKNGEVYRTTEVEVINPKIASDKTLGQMRGILEGVVKRGTAKNMQSPFFTSAGKTGTSQIFEKGSNKNKEGKTRHQVTFCGYFPADNPLYTCIVYARDYKQGGTGSICGEVYKKVAEKAFILHTQRKETTPTSDWNLSKAHQLNPTTNDLDVAAISELPDFTGMDISKALYILENQNIKVKITGSGIITKQSILPGTPTEKVQAIELTCEQP